MHFPYAKLQIHHRFSVFKFSDQRVNVTFYIMIKTLTVKGMISDDEQSRFWQSRRIFLSNLRIQTYRILDHNLNNLIKIKPIIPMVHRGL